MTRTAHSNRSAPILWRTLSHKGPLFQPTQVDQAKHTKPSCRINTIRVSHAAELTLRRMRAMKAAPGWKNRLPTERAAILNRFWSSWSELYAPGCTLPHNALNEKFLKVQKHHTHHTHHKHVTGFDVARVDGTNQPIANYKIEAPGVFAGRGVNHPLAGRVKRVLSSSNVTINISTGTKVPLPSDGGKWAAVVHDNTASWLACWKDPITGNMKYMRLAINAREDLIKFQNARKVAVLLPSVRARLVSELRTLNAAPDKHNLLVQSISCLLLLDQFALRVGGDSSDRVFGATTLRPEHVRLKHGHISFTFIGKDSMMCVGEGLLSKELYHSLSSLSQKKQPRQKQSSLFADLNERVLNEFIAVHLGKDATSKQLRTARACQTYEGVVLTMRRGYDDWRISAVQKLAVAKVAMLCNHRRQTMHVPDPVAERAFISDALDAVFNTKCTQSLVTSLVNKATAGLNLSTGPANYIDPRITRAFEARHGLTSGVFASSALRSKHAWADGTPATFKFCST